MTALPVRRISLRASAHEPSVRLVGARRWSQARQYIDPFSGQSRPAYAGSL